MDNSNPERYLRTRRLGGEKRYLSIVRHSLSTREHPIHKDCSRIISIFEIFFTFWKFKSQIVSCFCLQFGCICFEEVLELKWKNVRRPINGLCKSSFPSTFYGWVHNELKRIFHIDSIVERIKLTKITILWIKYVVIIRVQDVVNIFQSHSNNN